MPDADDFIPFILADAHRSKILRLMAHGISVTPHHDTESVRQAIIDVLGRKSLWSLQLAKRYCKHFHGPNRPTRRQIRLWLTSNVGARVSSHKGVTLRGKIVKTQSFRPRTEQVSSFQLPEIHHVGDLWRFLKLDSWNELAWLVAPNRYPSLRLQHYRARLVRKRSGQYRLVEAPRSRLKHVQRVILHEILDQIPVSNTCFGFVKQRDVKQFAAEHCCQGVVIRLDLQDFFPSIQTGRVHALWRFLGYEDEVATYLTWLCSIPPQAGTLELIDTLPPTAQHHLGEQCRRDRLPQGAPTSGALANLIAYRMDQRFAGFAAKSGGRYSRYADDLAFSWPNLSESQCERMIHWIATTVLECGFQVNFRKTRIMRNHQQQSLAGVVVNDRPAISRETVETLRATLFNCVRYGPVSQNREAHPDYQSVLNGKIAWVEHIHPSAGLRLRLIYNKIVW